MGIEKGSVHSYNWKSINPEVCLVSGLLRGLVSCNSQWNVCSHAGIGRRSNCISNSYLRKLLLPSVVISGVSSPL